MLRSRRDIQTEAIVLKVRTFGEDDLLVDFLTPEEGRLRGVARYGRKSRKRFGTILESLNIVRLRYQDRGGLVSLREAVFEQPLHHLEDNLKRLMTGLAFLDLISEWVPERNPDESVYRLLKDALVYLNQAPHPEKALRAFEKKLLVLLGYRPELSACLKCAKPWENQSRFFFVFREGGIFCLDCLPSSTPYEPVSSDHLPAILARFMEYQLGHPLKSYKFLTDPRFFV